MKERCLDTYPEVLTPEEAMVVLGVGRNTIYNLLKGGSIKSLRVGKLYRIPKASLMMFINSCYNLQADDQRVTCAKRGA